MGVYGYVRVSSNEQAKSGLSLAEQKQQILDWAQIAKLGEVTEIFEDAGVSGSIVLGKREAGGRLLSTLKSGDTLIITKLDRAFRRASDALNTVEDFKKRRISLHVRELHGDVSGNGISMLFVTIMSAVAEWERSIISDRQKDAKRQMREQGRYQGGVRKTGWVRVERDGKAYVRVDPDEQRAINYIRHHQDRELKVLQADIANKYGIKRSIPTISRIRKDASRYQESLKNERWRGNRSAGWKSAKQRRKSRGR